MDIVVFPLLQVLAFIHHMPILNLSTLLLSKDAREEDVIMHLVRAFDSSQIHL